MSNFRRELEYRHSGLDLESSCYWGSEDLEIPVEVSFCKRTSLKARKDALNDEGDGGSIERGKIPNSRILRNFGAYVRAYHVIFLPTCRNSFQSDEIDPVKILLFPRFYLEMERRRESYFLKLLSYMTIVYHHV